LLKSRPSDRSSFLRVSPPPAEARWLRYLTSYAGRGGTDRVWCCWLSGCLKKSEKTDAQEQYEETNESQEAATAGQDKRPDDRNRAEADESDLCRRAADTSWGIGTTSTASNPEAKNVSADVVDDFPVRDDANVFRQAAF
jgi:hypothetical protein